MPPIDLPAYMRKSNVDSVREECAPYRNMDFEERARELKVVCAGVPAMLARYSEEHRTRLAAIDDRLPESTRRALARLRREYREQQRGR